MITMSQRNPPSNPKTNQEFFTNLPSEIIINIFCRLPVRTIISCKCVCKSWLGLVETHEFAKSHLSKSVPGLAIFQSECLSHSYKMFEFEDGLDLQHHDLHYIPITRFDFPHAALIEGSANGLLFLRYDLSEPHPLHICNPITRDYIEIHCSQEFVYSYPQLVIYGFGASKMTDQHKVVRIFQDCIRDQETGELLGVTKSECQVYTLGTGSWRSIAPAAPFEYSRDTCGAFLNGNLHWLVYDSKCIPWISCFDIETELFSTFPAPPRLQGGERFLTGVFALGDRLCLCENTPDDVIVIWLMKEYEVEKSWTEEFVICKIHDFLGGSHGVVYPIKVFKDGDILMAWEDMLLFSYSSKSKTAQNIDIFELHGDVFNSILHTTSFLSLKSFAIENVSSF